MNLRICYGGTFDPIHDGHVSVARFAQALFQADLYFIPSADPPHRQKPLASAVQRASMIELAIRDERNFFLDTRELNRSTPSYTVDTLRELRQQIGSLAPIAWLIGADAFSALHTWHEWPALFELTHFIVAVRPGYPWQSTPIFAHLSLNERITESAELLQDSPAGRVFPLQCLPRSESASAIRRALAKGEHPVGLNPAVQAYILEHGLYPKAL